MLLNYRAQMSRVEGSAPGSLRTGRLNLVSWLAAITRLEASLPQNPQSQTRLNRRPAQKGCDKPGPWGKFAVEAIRRGHESRSPTDKCSGTASITATAIKGSRGLSTGYPQPWGSGCFPKENLQRRTVRGRLSRLPYGPLATLLPNRSFCCTHRHGQLRPKEIR